MIDDKIHVAIASWKRAGIVSTVELFPFGWIWIPESQEKEYREFYGDRVIVLPDVEDGSISRKYNAILDKSPCKWTLILNDDIRHFGFWEDGEHHEAGPEQIRRFIISAFLLADELGVKLWGVNQRRDELAYQTFKPFNLLAPILGPFMGHLDTTLRHDETLELKHDYDFWLQNILYHRKTLRLNKWHYVCGHGKNLGGYTGIRTMKMELDQAERMRRKWGNRIYKLGGVSGGRSATGKNPLNSRVRVPIPGC